MTQDVFKKVYTVMPEEIKNAIFEMKSKAEELKAFFDQINSREMSIAQTNLEQTLMWATKAYVNEGDRMAGQNEACIPDRINS
jgi:3-oxoacyl-[acyl-carrier-protein] synthase III